MKLKDVKKEFAKYMIVKDPYILDVIMATLIANFTLLKDPVWLMVVAPSSGGKSTFIAPIAGMDRCAFIDDLTEKTFLSGYKAGPKGKEMSLLKQIGSGVLCFSDFTSVLSKNPMTRSELLGQLRLVYDGVFTKRTGTGEIIWKGKMGFIGACTPDIYNLLEASRAMGERFLYFTMQQPTDDEIVKKQKEVKISAKQIAEIMHPFYQGYFNSINEWVGKNGQIELDLTAEQEDRINYAAKFCVAAKATVHLDFKTQRPDSLVNKPGVGRDRKMMQTLLQSLLTMACYETDNKDHKATEEMLQIIERAAYSSVSPERRKILEVLTSFDTTMTASEIGAVDEFGLAREAVERYLYVLHSVGLIQRTKKGTVIAWVIKEDKEKSFIRAVAGVKTRSIAEIQKTTESSEEEAQVELSAEDETERQKALKDF